MTTPLIITCALVGAELSREDTPHLPLTPDEIAAAAKEAVDAGASVIHLHVRDEAGRPTQRLDVFQAVSEKIRQQCDCILQYSTGGAVGTPVAERAAPLRLKPDMASLSMGSMNFGPDLFENTEQTIRTLADAMRQHQILPELEIFDLGMLESVARFKKQGYLPEHFHIDFVLGVPGGMSGELRNLLLLIDRLPAGQSWSVAGIGRCQLPLTTHAIALGGHVRVGLEDNIYYRKGELARSNAQLVARVTRIAKELDRPVATTAQARQLLGLQPPGMFE